MCRAALSLVGRHKGHWHTSLYLEPCFCFLAVPGKCSTMDLTPGPSCGPGVSLVQSPKPNSLEVWLMPVVVVHACNPRGG